jgi:hypothetical protein
MHQPCPRLLQDKGSREPSDSPRPPKRSCSLPLTRLSSSSAITFTVLTLALTRDERVQSVNIPKRPSAYKLSAKHSFEHNIYGFSPPWMYSNTGHPSGGGVPSGMKARILQFCRLISLTAPTVLTGELPGMGGAFLVSGCHGIVCGGVRCAI